MKDEKLLSKSKKKEGDIGMRYEFSFITTEEDYFEFSLYDMYNSKYGKKHLMWSRFWVIVTLTIIAIVLGAIVKSMTVDPINVYIIYMAIGMGAMLHLIFFKDSVIRQLKKNIKKLKESGKLFYDKESHATFTDDGFFTSTQKWNSNSTYAIAERVEVGQAAVYLYIGVGRAQIIPNRVFLSDSEKNEFVEFLRSKIDRGDVGVDQKDR